MADEESAPTDSLEDHDVPAKDSAVPDPTGARHDSGTQDAINDATQAAKDDIAGTLSDPSAGEQEPAEGSRD